jgi:acyl carrier protein
MGCWRELDRTDLVGTSELHVASLERTRLTNLIIQWVRNNGQTGELSHAEIGENTDLMAAGLLDSFGFIDLVLYLEDQCNVKIELTDVEPDEFTVIKGLCNIVLSGPAGGHQQPIEKAANSDLQQPPE